MSTWILCLGICTIFSLAHISVEGFYRRHNLRTGFRSCFQNVKHGFTYDFGKEELKKRQEEEELFANLTEGLTVLPDPGVFLEILNNLSTIEYHKNALAQWNFESNITSVTRELALKASARLAKFQKTVWKTAMGYDWKNFDDESSVKRQFRTFSILGTAALPDEEFSKLNEVINKMESIYSTATISPYVKINETKNLNDTKEADIKKKPPERQLRLEPDLIKIMSESREVDELKYVWKSWRDKTGKKMRKYYLVYVELMKEVAKLNNFSSVAEYWTQPYEDPNFKETISSLWQEVKPFYLELHAYVRNKLRTKYGPEVVPESGYIPAHLFGDMWTQSWIHLNKDTMPYPESSIPDMTSGLRSNNFTKIEFFKLADDFFRSLGFPELPETFWLNSIIERPEDNKTELVCHGSAWDMYDGKDFRIKMCTQITYDDLLIVHHEMGHVQYYIQYKNQPLVFREGANPGFHEAIGDTIALSVSSLPHACGLGLVENGDYDSKIEINYLYMMALQKVAFLPFAYCVDKWRWAVFGDEVTPEAWNSLWWKLRGEIQGIEPPLDRRNDDFDPGSKYHIAADVPYIRYFVSFVIQFQFHEAVCLNAGQYDPDDIKRPLHRCDIYGSMEAGIAMRQMMRMGSSEPWQNAMERLTGDREIKTKGLLAYFRPLYHWLKEQNSLSKVPVGF